MVSELASSMSANFFIPALQLGSNNSQLVINSRPMTNLELSRIDEQRLVADCCAGDERAFRELVTRHQRLVASIASHFLDNRSDLEDLVQDVFLSIFKSLNRFRGDSSLKTWIYRITVNHCINWRKRVSFRFRRRWLSLHESPSGDTGIPRIETISARAKTPEAEVIQAEQMRQVRAAIQKLPVKFRMVLVLRDLEELSYEEIARIVGVSNGTVKSRINRARTKVRVLLAEVLPDEL